MTGLLNFSIVLLFVAATNALVQFDASYLIDHIDLNITAAIIDDYYDNDNGNPDLEGVLFSCPGTGCTLYTTKMTTNDVILFDGNKEIATLDKLYQKKDGFLVGFHLEKPKNYDVYTLKKREGVETNVPFKVFVVADSAGAGNVVDLDDDTPMADINAGGRQLITVLSASTYALTFSNFKGTEVDGGKPLQVYSNGYDMVTSKAHLTKDSCKPVFTARSHENAMASVMAIPNGLATIDFGSAEMDNTVHIENTMKYDTDVKIGQSFVVMSPGYHECAQTPLERRNSMQSYNFHAETQSTRADFVVSTMKIPTSNVIYISSTNNALQKISGSSPQTNTVESENLLYTVIWAPANKKQFLHAQVDFTKGVSSAFGFLSALAVLMWIM